MTQKRIKLETAYSLARNSLIAISRDGECQCGSPPYTDGNPCNACFAAIQLQILPELSTFKTPKKPKPKKKMP